MEDFIKKIENDVIIIVVNISRATYNDAMIFKKILTHDIIERKFKKIIIDISKCDFIDSTFLGAIVYCKRELDKLGGQLRIIQPDNNFGISLERTSILEVLKSYNTIELAMESFNFNV